MKKLLAFVPLLAGGAWAGTTLVVGSQSEPAYNDLIAQLNQESPVPFVVESYEKGYLNSTAITKVMASKAADAEVALRLKHVISHSTVAMDDAGARVGKSAIKTTLLFNDDTDPELQKMLDGFNGLAPVEMISRVGISGEADNILTLNPYSSKEGDTSIVSGGGEIRFSVGDDRSIIGRGSMKPVNATNSTLEVFASDAADFDFNLTPHELGFYHGSQRYSVSRIAGIDPTTSQPFELTDVLLDASSDFSGDAGNGNLLFSVGGIKTMLPVNSGSFETNITGLSVAAIAGFKQLMAKVENLPEGDVEAAKGVASEYAKLLTELFQGGSSMAYKLKLNNDGGAAVADLNINRVIDAAAFTNDTTLGDLLRSLAGELSFDADGAAIDLTPMGFMLQGPPASDFISFDGTKYNSKAVLSNNVVDLNGNKFPLDMMLGPYLTMSLTDAMGFLE